MRALCCLLSAALAGPAWPQAAKIDDSAAARAAESNVRLPALGESASDEFNLNAEKRIGDQIMREVRRDPDYLDDPVLLDYLQSLWQPLVRAARARGDIDRDSDGLFPYEAFLVRDRSVNAFALPGGYVGVHLGLIGITSSGDELASVLAHELSHVTQRHIARSVVAAQRSSTLSLVAMVLGVLAASRAQSTDMAQAAIVGGQAAAAQAQLNFSRDMEREADRNGYNLMTQAGFAPGGMAAMFEKLDSANRINDSGGFPYLRSHPLTVDRVGEARQRASTSGAATPRANPLRHALMQARSRVLMDASTQALRRQQETVPRNDATPTQRLAAHYTRALASVRLRDFTLADEALAAGTPLLADAEGRSAWAQLAGETAIARGQAPRAAQALATLPADGTRSQLLLRAQLALLAGDPAILRDSTEALQAWVAEHRGDAGAWRALAGTSERLNQPLRSLRAQAEAQAALGDLQGAMDRLRAGQQLAKRGGPNIDFIEASVIDARLRDLLAQRRQLIAEQRGPERGPRTSDPE
ncbi:M48 family metalloprotease [Aquincola sp. S2]|uniref:M48 family metalloprotease n=1 Tax=Pseudaquabacterium terrae TaxID=2732868 RepID=A0ABX2EL00_9BURK|nr:M48 family metalloprotease [Aquabacterium terrae]